LWNWLGEGRARVTGEAAALDEGDHAAFLLLGHRPVVADQPEVEGRVGRIEGPLEGGECQGHVVGVDRVVVAGEGGVELLDIDVELGDALQRLLERHRHFDLGLDRAQCLFLEGRGPAVPELGAEEAGSEHLWGVALADLPVVADGARAAIGVAERRVVAGGAGDDARGADPRLEEQHPAELDPRASAFELWLAIGGIAGSGSKKPW
jgi:hypothetical protein